MHQSHIHPDLRMSLLRIPSSTTTLTITRSVSSKYIKPHPRSYRRRLYEAAVAPVLPPKARQECNLGEFLARMDAEYKSYADIELAEVTEIKRWIKEEGFRVMAVCEYLSVNGRTLWLTKNQLRLQGLEFREISNKLAAKLFEKTPLDSLAPLWIGHNAFLFGKNVEDLKTIITATQKVNFLVPLVLTFDSRIVSVKEAEELAKLPDVELLRAQTAQILDQIPVQLTQSLGQHGQELSNILGQISTPTAE
uniref:Large ribosomal subunit protein uL10m n=1 Tax=Panagrellus redivivus TaxID=6233 RepID=A0A7E4VMH8_PANRE